MTSMQSPGAYNTQPPTSDDEEFCFTSKRPEGRPELVHLQHPSCFRQFSYGSVSSDNDDACFIDALEQPQCPFEDDLGSHGSPQPSVGEQLSRARQGSIVDGLLHEIYDRWHYSRHDSIDSDTMTECSSTSEFFFHSRHEAGGYHSAIERRHGGQLNRSFHDVLIEPELYP